MKSLFEFLYKKRHAIIWTACYFAMMWTVLYTLFGFDMTSIYQWNRLMHARLAGFGGFVFGILILAAIPMYVATTSVIWRNNKPLFTIPVPECVRRAFAPPAPPAPEPEPEPVTATPDTDIYNIPNHIPTELHGAFIRVRNGTGRPQISTFNTLNMAGGTTAAPDVTAATGTPADTDTPDDFPIPTDFDMADDIFGDNFGPQATMPAMPTFSDITFDDTPTKPAAAGAPDVSGDPADATVADTDTKTDMAAAGVPDNAVTKTLRAVGIEFTIDGEIILTDHMAIAVHDDPDFWIADDETWFADGRSRPSPIAALKTHTASTGRRAILYLGATNILDFDQMRTKWESDGIRIVTDPSELLN